MMKKKNSTIDSESILKISTLSRQRLLNYQSDIEHYISSEEISSVGD